MMGAPLALPTREFKISRPRLPLVRAQDGPGRSQTPPAHQAQSTGLQDTPAPASDGEGEVQPASTTPRMNTRLRTRVCHSLYPQWPCAPLSYTLPDDRQPPP